MYILDNVVTKYSSIAEAKFNHGYGVAKKSLLNLVGNKDQAFEKFNFKLILKLRGKKLLESFRLRAKIFCHELKWVGNSSSVLEVDGFDFNSTHVGILDSKNKIVGTFRTTSHQYQWHMEKYFPDILPSNFSNLKNHCAIEVSRLAIENDLRAKYTNDGKGIIDLMYKGLFYYCQSHQISHVYSIISTVMLKYYKLHRIPFKAIGSTKVMPDGVAAVVAVLDWNILFESEKIRDIKTLEWLQGPDGIMDNL